MAVSLPTDIVMDVARAADPARFRVAVNKLDSKSDYAAVAKDIALAFSATDTDETSLQKSLGAQLPFDVERARLRLGGRDGFSLAESLDISTTGGLLSAEKLRSGTSYQQFEALALQKFVEAMLPKESASWYGGGFAGDTWKSMLAEQVAKELARSGGIGIANMIEKAHPSDNKARGIQSSANSLDSFQKKITSSGELA